MLLMLSVMAKPVKALDNSGSLGHHLDNTFQVRTQQHLFFAEPQFLTRGLLVSST
jgi:hypothetical protein